MLSDKMSVWLTGYFLWGVWWTFLMELLQKSSRMGVMSMLLSPRFRWIFAQGPLSSATKVIQGMETLEDWCSWPSS
jgi:hypothetical protein